MTNDQQETNIIKNRRRVPRRKVELKVGVLVNGTYEIANAFEIGEGGMLIDHQARELEVGQIVLISYSLPRLFQEVIRGTIKFKSKEEPYKYGIQFQSVDFEIRRKIRNFVAAATDKKQTA